LRTVIDGGVRFIEPREDGERLLILLDGVRCRDPELGVIGEINNESGVTAGTDVEVGVEFGNGCVKREKNEPDLLPSPVPASLLFVPGGFCFSRRRKNGSINSASCSANWLPSAKI